MAQYKTFSTMAKDPDSISPESMGDIPHITSASERKALIRNNKVVVIDYYTDWCAPCKLISPKFSVLSKKYGRPGLCAFAKENAEDQCGEWPSPIKGVPCFHFYVNGHYQDEMTITGADIGAVESTISKLLS